MSRPEIGLHKKQCKMKKTDIKKRPHPPTVFSDEFKIKIITEYLETDLTKREILDKYGIRSNSPIQKWMRKLGIIDPYAKKDYLGVTPTERRLCLRSNK